MSRIRKCTINRAFDLEDVMHATAALLKEEISLGEAAKRCEVSRGTLKKYLD